MKAMFGKQVLLFIAFLVVMSQLDMFFWQRGDMNVLKVSIVYPAGTTEEYRRLFQNNTPNLKFPRTLYTHPQPSSDLIDLFIRSCVTISSRTLLVSLHLLMTSTMADLLLLILVVTAILLLCAGLERRFSFPFLNPTKLEAKVLLIGLEDLTLPLGSFPINLLHPWAGLSSIGAGLNTAKSPPSIEPITDDSQPVSSKGRSDKHLYDPIDYQHLLDEDNQNAGPETGLPHPENNPAKNGPLDGVATATGEQKYQQQQWEKKGSTAAMEKLLSETQAFEKSIRELVDPHGIYGLDLQKMVKLVAHIIERRSEAEESLISEKVRFERAEEGLGHERQDMKEDLERVIDEQKATLKWTQQKYDEILDENETLLSEKTALENYQRMMDQYNENLKTLEDAKEWAEHDARTAKAELKSRIHAVSEKHRQERLAAEQHTGRERNTLLCRVRMFEDTLNRARRQVTLGEHEHKAAMRESGQVNQHLCATVQKLRLTLEASQELASSTEQRLRTQLDDQGRKKDHEISIIKGQHQDLTREVNVVRRGKYFAEQDSQRLSDSLQKQTTSLQADKKRIEDDSRREIKGLRRRIAGDQVIINDYIEEVIRLETGEEVQGLVSQLEDCKEQLQQSAKDAQDAEKQLKDRRWEIQNLRGTIKARDQKIQQDAEISSTENENLKKQLEQAIRVSDSRLEEEARKLKEQERESSRIFEMEKEKAVENANSKAVEDAKGRQEEHEKDKKDALQFAVSNAAEHAEKKEEEHRKEMKDAVQKAVKKAVEETRQAHQQQLEAEAKSSREAQLKATKIENDLRTEMGVLKSQVEQGSESKSRNPASAQPDFNAKELIVQTREADEANNLLLEIGRNGIAQDSVEHVVVRELSNAKLALYNLKCILREQGLDVVKDELVSVIASGKVDEENIQKLNATTWAELVKQTKWAQVRLLNVEEILATTSDNRTEKLLEAINAPYREIKKARGSKRHTKEAPGTLPPVLQNHVQVAIPTSALQTPSSTMRGSASSPGVPGSTNDGRSSMTPKRQEDQRNGALGFHIGDRDKSHHVWADVFTNSGEAAKPQGSANAESSSAQYNSFTEFRFGRHPPS